MDPIDPWKWFGHIVASYAVSAVVIAALLGWLFVDARRQQAAVDELEARGVKRRSARR